MIQDLWNGTWKTWTMIPKIGTMIMETIKDGTMVKPTNSQVSVMFLGLMLMSTLP